MPQTDVLTAERLRNAWRVAERWLALNRNAINAINVYPVPDGDTGTNMLLTVRAALEAAERAEPAGLGAWTKAFSLGALLGARGNSGVILSQMIRGLADALADAEETDVAGLARALERASSTAYGAVSTPVEGTMLTVMREAAAAATALFEAGGGTLSAVLAAAEAEAERSVARTPDLLPRLREAGVVDSGGLGIAVLLTGLRCGLLGEALPEAPGESPAAVVLSAVEHEGHGYCTEFVLLGAALERGGLERALEALGGDSILVVGDATALHVHVHLVDPGPALSAGAARGSLSAVKVEDMQAQHKDWVAGHEASANRTALAERLLGLVAVVPGPGIAAAFRALGAVTVQPRDGAKPSAGELLAAARGAGRHVLLLPNDKDVLLAAGAAAAEAPDLLTVVPSRNIAAGLSAALAYHPEGDAAETARAMLETLSDVRCVEVTRAARDATTDGVTVAAGDPIVLVDGVLVARAPTEEEALLMGIQYADPDGEAELVTVYLGAGAPVDTAETLAARIEGARPDVAVEVIDGGQPHYPYVAGVE